MKKHTLFKILGIIILAYCILTWVLPAKYYYGGSLQDLGRYQIGLFSIFNVPVTTVGYFASIFVFILIVGGFYALLEETGFYKKALDTLSKKMKNKKLWLVIITVIIAIVSSVAGLEVATFAFFPFLISLLLVMGFSKMTALTSVLGATIVGMFGSTYSYTMYGVINSILGTTLKDGIIVKLILFVLGLTLLLLLILLPLQMKENKTKDKKKNIKTKKEQIKEKVKDEVKEVDTLISSITSEVKYKGCKKVWPIYLILGLVLLVFILGTLNFKEAFGITVFDNINTWINEFTIFKFPILKKLFGGFTVFGSWFGPEKYIHYSTTLIIFSLILCLIYKIDLNAIIEKFLVGVKKYLPIGALVIMSYALLVIVSSYPIYLTVGEKIVGATSSFNTLTYGTFTILGSPLYVDIYYYPQYVLQFLQGLSGQASLKQALSILFVSLYSAVMLVAPTSVLLLSTLQLTETSYKEWLKTIWKLFVGLVIISLVVITIFTII